ncbi:MAG: hypothetical protein EZS28_005961 [Streblomastix strix]|uniref:Uncharacterized protein n=1 Tax=Streblomastix strix TaxID=222440 RepID=A0A5J4WUC9_9EUKA|nr:MAG: hypothetical protein EZS28_005961 [Streblomastix strix]
MLQRGKDGNAETEYAVIKACEAASYILRWHKSDQFISLEEKEFIDTYILFLSALPLIKFKYQHLLPMLHFKALNQDLNSYIIQKGIIRVINKVIENVMKRIASLIQDLISKSVEQRAVIAELGVLDEAQQYLQRIRSSEDGMSGVIDPVCELMSLIFEGNPQLIPIAMQENGIVDLLVANIYGSLTESLHNQIELLLTIVNESLDDSLQEMFRRGVIRVVINHLDSEYQNPQLKASEIIMLIVQSGSVDVKVGEQNRYRNEIQKDGTLQILMDFFIDDKIIRAIKVNIVQTISLLFKALPLPSEYGYEIVKVLKMQIIGIDDNKSSITLSILCGLAECEANHAYILSDGFIKEIEQCLKNKERKKTCCEALHLLIALIKNGSSQTKEIIQKGIQITLIQQHSFSRNKKIAKVAKELIELLKD